MTRLEFSSARHEPIKEKDVYVDGCSYVSGCESVGLQWNNGFQDLPFQHLGGILDFLYAPGWQPFNKSFTAKSNPQIFADFLYNLKDIIIRNESAMSPFKVLIYWSHCERELTKITDNPDDIDLRGSVANKGLSNGFEIDWRDVTDGEGGGILCPRTGNITQNDTYAKFLARHMTTINYMLAVQKLCEIHDIDYRFITTDPYEEFKKVPDHEQLNINKIFNWPLPGTKSKLDLNDKLLFNCWWGTRSFALQFGRAFGSKNNKNYIHTDMKHLNIEGAALLTSMIKEWWDNPQKDLQWYYENELGSKDKLYFVDEEAHWKEVINANVDKHWIEKNIMEHQDILLAPAKFIYEE